MEVIAAVVATEEVVAVEVIAEDIQVRIKEKVLQHIAVVEEVIQVRLMLELTRHQVMVIVGGIFHQRVMVLAVVEKLLILLTE